jgi:hypothetical protein
MIDTDKYEGHTPADEWEIHLVNALFETEFPMTYADNQLMADAPLILAAYDKQVRWINDILFRLEKMDEASTGQRLRFLLTVQDELEMMIK